MMKRQALSRKKSQRTFRKGVNKVHPFNGQLAPRYVMRGGIRM